MTEFETVISLTDKLTLSEKLKLIEHLTHGLRKDITTDAYKKLDWATFVDQTYGSLADDPLERPEQPPMDVRDEIE